MRIRKGDVVKIQSGEIGMVVRYKSNDEIGINFGHYRIAMIEKDEKRKEDLLLAIKQGKFGLDIETDIPDIKENITQGIK